MNKRRILTLAALFVASITLENTVIASRGGSSYEEGPQKTENGHRPRRHRKRRGNRVFKGVVAGGLIGTGVGAGIGAAAGNTGAGALGGAVGGSVIGGAIGASRED